MTSSSPLLRKYSNDLASKYFNPNNKPKYNANMRMALNTYSNRPILPVKENGDTNIFWFPIIMMKIY